MQLANQEAQRFNHEYIGTEHVLLGLIKEGSGVACHVLRNMGIEVGEVRKRVEDKSFCGPDMVTMGKLPQTPRTKQVILYAIEEAKSLKHTYVGTEHLLLGLVREDGGLACDVLKSFDLKLEDIRQETLELLGYSIPEEKESDQLLMVQRVAEHLAIEDGLLSVFAKIAGVTDEEWKKKVEEHKKSKEAK
jgi:ATP-dependent Clp protease ATP-binding subunit ClpC